MPFLNALNKTSPIRKKYLRANHSRFISKELSKEFIVRTKRNKFRKEKTTQARKAYNKQRNICVSILLKSKRLYFENVDIKYLGDNKTFWRKCKTALFK